MEFKKNLPVVSALLMLFVIQACHAHMKSAQTTADAQLMCYVCDNCAQITAQTPLEPCNEEFFTGTTVSTTTITTDSTLMTTADATVPSTVDTTTETVVTDPAPPVPPTVGPPVTTTAMPTPPNPGTVIVPIEDAAKVEEENENSRTPPILTTTPSSIDVTTTNRTDVSVMNATSTTTEVTTTPQLLVRQLRQAINTDVTYHCYRIQKSQNGTSVIERGCSRVTTMEAVCSQLKMNNADSSVSKCFPCSNSRCNGSSSLGISVMTLFIAVVAALLYRK